MGVAVLVKVPSVIAGFASAVTPVKLVLALIAAASAIPLADGLLLETSVLENLSSCGVVRRMAIPLISRSSIPKFLVSATWFAATSVAATLMVAPVLADDVIVNDTPGVRAVR